MFDIITYWQDLFSCLEDVFSLFDLIFSLLCRLRSRHLLLGASVVQASSFDWDEMRASETDIIKYSQQIDNCRELTLVSLFI